MNQEAWQDLPASMTGIYCATVADPHSPVYTTAELLEIHGDLDFTALEDALRLTYSEQQAIGAEFRHSTQEQGLEQGVADFRIQWRPSRRLDSRSQQILDYCRLPHRENQLDHVKAWCLERASQPLPVLEGWGVDAVIIQAGTSIWLYHAVHHLIADGYAVHSLLGRWAQVYRDLIGGQEIGARILPSLADLSIQSRDQRQKANQDIEKWVTQLQGYDLSSDTSVAQASAPAQAVPYRSVRALDSQLQIQLLQVSRRLGVGWAQLVTAAVGSYLARAARSETVRAAIPLMNRTLPGNKASAQSLCSAVNLLPLVIPAGGEIGAQAQVVAQQMAFAQEHSLARYEDLERLTDTRGCLTTAQINVIPFRAALDFGAGTTGTVHNLLAGPVENITVCLRGMPGLGAKVSLEVDLNPALYSYEDSGYHADRLLHWLEQYTELGMQGGWLEELEQLTGAEKMMLESFNATERTLTYRPLAQRFLEMSRLYPQAPALWEAAPYLEGTAEGTEFGHRVLTYQELAEKSLRYATALKQLGVQRQDRIGLRVERGLEQFILVYALLHLGAVYVPLDPALPASRLRSMCEDADIRCICEGPGVTAMEESLACRVWSWEEISLQAQKLPTAQIMESGAGSELLAEETIYVLFTSGSTGKPKGVATSALALSNRLAWQQDLVNLEQRQRVFHKTPISFDVHIWELYWALTEGASIVIAAPGSHREPLYLLQALDDMEIDIVHFVPSMLSAFLDMPHSSQEETAKSRRYPRAFICSGEQLPLASVQEIHRRYGVPVHNLYGPTEAAIDVTAFSAYPQERYSAIPIGQPVWNTRLSIRDTAGQLCPPGVVGELHLHGIQVAKGYLNREELSRIAFYRDSAGQASYRTGDLASWDYQGYVHYRGRADSQVKIRGQRVDLGEIESLLGEHPKVSKIAAVYYPDQLGRLAVFIEPRASVKALTTDELLAFARENLPDYMVPQEWVFKKPLPLTPNGKIDRKELGKHTFQSKTSEVPNTLVSSLFQEELCRIFGQILGVYASSDTDFFASGGNSIAALHTLATIQKQTGRQGSLSQFFKSPTPRLLAEALEGEQTDDFLPVLALRTTVSRDAPYIFVPPAGGLGWCYHPYLLVLPPNRTVWAVQSAAYSHDKGRPAETITDLADEYLRSLNRAGLTLEGATLVGWSLGGMVAQEMAYLLEKSKISLARLILLDAYPQSSWRQQEPPGEQDQWRAIARMGGVDTSCENLSRAKVIELLRAEQTALGALDADKLDTCIDNVQRAMGLVRRGNPHRIEAPTLLLSAAQSERSGLDPLSWEEYCTTFQHLQVAQEHVEMVQGSSLAQFPPNIL